uniref:(northern house mosquito) hypothetical protein n=1 Tax=Culex pipiens TaxID=7175 RepID=A0A8D8G442_CULPI
MFSWKFSILKRSRAKSRMKMRLSTKSSSRRKRWYGNDEAGHHCRRSCGSTGDGTRTSRRKRGDPSLIGTSFRRSRFAKSAACWSTGKTRNATTTSTWATARTRVPSRVASTDFPAGPACTATWLATPTGTTCTTVTFAEQRSKPKAPSSGTGRCTRRRSHTRARFAASGSGARAT